MGLNTVREFPAILKTLEGKILEYGTASVSPENQSLDFKGEFVPVCKMGTQLEVVRVQEKVEIQRFTGEVYLSSRRLLRLVSLTDEVLPSAASVCSCDVSIEGRAAASIPSKLSHGLFHMLHRHREPLTHVQAFHVKIHAISMSRIKFTCDLPLPCGQVVTISTTSPIQLNLLAVEVELPVTFGDSKTYSYRCRIRDLAGENYLALEKFMREMSVKENKLFPPVVNASETEHP